jgi:hypothetical protein
MTYSIMWQVHQVVWLVVGWGHSVWDAGGRAAVQGRDGTGHSVQGHQLEKYAAGADRVWVERRGVRLDIQVVYECGGSLGSYR